MAEICWRIVEREHGKARLYIECDKLGVNHGRGVRECGFSLWRKGPIDSMWSWDGNSEAPTINPSINCHGGCERHFVMTKGKTN